MRECKKYFILIFYVIINSSFSLAQVKDLSIEEQIKSLRDLSSGITINYKNDTITKLLNYLKLYNEKGLIKDSLIVKNDLEKLTGKIGIISNYVYGDYLTGIVY